MLAAVLGVAAGCDGKTESGDSPRSCSNDSDCPAHQECAVAAASIEQAIVAPCTFETPCTQHSMCGANGVCAPFVPMPGMGGINCPALVCKPSCKSAGCGSDETCGDDGLCRLTRCDEPGATACAEHYRCDPEAAATASTQALNGSSVQDVPNSPREIQRGCVRKSCDEPDGFVCRATWRCDPANAQNEASGCVPVACQETGSCSDDNVYICEPQNDGQRPNGMDVHGCVIRNCGEGYQCQQIRDSVNYASCDLGSPEADTWGCVVQNCEEVPELCASGSTCDRASKIKDVFGCRRLDCHDPGGPACTTGTSCQLLSQETGLYTCRPDVSGTGGSGGAGRPSGGTAGLNAGGTVAGGAGGSAGTVVVPASGGRSTTGGATSSSGNTATGGADAPPEPIPNGVCVDR